MKICALDLPLNSIKAPDISGYFNRLLSKKRNEIVEERLRKKFHLNIPTGGTYTLGLLSIASSLVAQGYTVNYEVFDQFNQETILKNNHLIDSNVILFSCKTTTYPLALEIARAVKAFRQDVITIFGGPHCNVMPDEVIVNEQVDFVVVGEGELIVPDVIRALEGHQELHAIPGVLFKDETGGVVHNRTNTLISKLENIPPINFDLLPGKLSDYHVYVETSRGCKYDCSFCANPLFWEKKVRCYDVERVYSTLKRISSVLPENTLVHLVDPSYGNSKSIVSLCEMLEQSPLPLRFSCDINALHVKKAVIEKMYKAGVRMFCIGIESINETVLRINHKPQTAKLVYEACRTIKETTDAFVKTYWIVGLPGETEESCRQSRDAAIDMLNQGLIDLVCEHVFVPYPGCDIFHNPETYRFRITHRDWGKYDSRSFPLPGESMDFSMERVFIAYLDFLRAQCEYYGISDRMSLLELSNDYDFRQYKGSLV